MNDTLAAMAQAYFGGDGYEELSERLELESIRYNRALPEEGEARAE